MFALPESWVWDFWFADDGEYYHLFFLYASKALRDPDARHYRASIGHAVSTDLTNWTRVEDALVRADTPAFDDLATWTGSVVRHPDGTWFLFYTGSTCAPNGKNVQRIGYATSQDLITWDRAPDNPVLSADPLWYETLLSGEWHDEAFRDPGCSPTRTATAGTCSSPLAPRPANRSSAAWSATRSPPICGSGNRARH